jgi:hypothetical protein
MERMIRDVIKKHLLEKERKMKIYNKSWDSIQKSVQIGSNSKFDQKIREKIAIFKGNLPI